MTSGALADSSSRATECLTEKQYTSIVLVFVFKPQLNTTINVGLGPGILPHALIADHFTGCRVTYSLNKKLIAGRPCEAKACQGLLKWTWK